MLKKYYRVSELNESFGLTDADVQYLSAETDVTFCLYCKSTELIMGGWANGKFSGFGKAMYTGLISMTRNQQNELFEQNKLTLSNSRILQKEKIANYSSDYPFSVETPNSVIERWYCVAFEQLPFDKEHFRFMPFCFYPVERTSMLKEFENMCKSLANSADTSTPYERSEPIDKELFYKTRSFTLNDVCITSDELVKANRHFARNILSSLEMDEPKKVSESNKSQRPIDVLLNKILNQYPDESASQIWNRLGEDILNDPRQFDTDEIIDEIGNDILYWFDIRSELKQMKKKSFYNLIRELKKV